MIAVWCVVSNGETKFNPNWRRVSRGWDDVLRSTSHSVVRRRSALLRAAEEDDPPGVGLTAD